MINFLPLIYHDELLFSVICRYKQMCGMESKRALELDLFQIHKRRMGRKSVLFPQNLQIFVSNLPPTSKFSIKEIIMNHTMFPFYTAFLSNQVSDKVFKGMEEGAGKSIENLVGMAGSKVKSSNYLRYCPLCFKEDVEKLGLSYWRRLPQIPGALYCPIHQILYKESNVVMNDSRNDYLCADEDTCDTNISTDDYSDEIKKLNLKYVENASFILFHNQNRRDLSFIINFYIDKLREKRLASNAGSLYIDRLLEEFLQYYPSEYLELMQSGIDVKQEANWLRLFVRNNNKNRSPLRHLLFLQFLNVGVMEIFESNSVIGKISVSIKRNPLLSIDEKRKDWLKLIKENPNANRSELKSIAKGLHTWVYMNDWDWYNKVTPIAKTRKKKAGTIDWEKRDEEGLLLAKKAVENLLNKGGKPIRIIPSCIKREAGVKRWFLHPKLVKTQKYIKEIEEDIESYRIRKIKWAINEMMNSGEKLTAYKIQVRAGLGGGGEEVKKVVLEILDQYK